MSPEQLCARVDRDLGFLAVEFIHHGFAGAAMRLLEMRQSLRGESLFGDDGTPAEIAELLSAVEGGAA